jgi:hypothetical protein
MKSEIILDNSYEIIYNGLTGILYGVSEKKSSIFSKKKKKGGICAKFAGRSPARRLAQISVEDLQNMGVCWESV